MTSEPDSRIELEIEVSATPDQVWAAIATGPGVSAWMHPTAIDEQQGGEFSYDMGAGHTVGTVSAWDPPRRFVQHASWQPEGGIEPATLATDWLIEARDGATCVVRMVMTGFGSGDDWDDEIAGMADGMRQALQGLRHYLETGEASPDAAVRAVLVDRAQAFADRNATAFVDLYTADAVHFVLPPPLQLTGRDKDGIQQWFDSFDDAVDRKVTKLRVFADNTIATAFSLVNMDGTRDGQPVGFWYRETVALRNADDG